MFKKAIALLTATIVASMTFAGCSSSNTSTTSNTSTPPTTSDSSTSTNKSETPETTDTTKEPVKLTLWMTSREQDDATTAIEEEFLKRNPHITLNKVIKEGDPGNEFYQAVAAGNAPDLVSTSFTMMDKYINAGILEPLNTYFEKIGRASCRERVYVLV